MAYEEILQSITGLSSGDLSSYQYSLVRPTTQDPPRYGPVAARGALALGVLQDNTTATGASIKIGVFGVSKVLAGDTSACETDIVPGTALMASSVGRAVPTTASPADHAIGFALAPLTTGTLGTIPMLISRFMSSSS